MTSEQVTQELLSLCESSDWNPEPAAVKSCVRRGANILFRGPKMHDPILATLVSKGRCEAVEACLLTLPVASEDPPLLDLTLTGDGDRTALHWIFERSNSDETVKKMLKTFITRIDMEQKKKGSGGGVLVDWGQMDWEGEDVLSRAGRNQQLSLTWFIIKPHVFAPTLPPSPEEEEKLEENEKKPLYGSILPIPLHGEFWAWDWESLGSDRDFFYFQNLVECDATDSGNTWRMKSRCEKNASRLIKGDRASGLLYRTCMSFPDPALVARLVGEGADVLFSSPDLNNPILNTFMKEGHVECVAACLQTPRSLDLTKMDYAGGTPLRYICFGAHNGPDKVRQLLNLFIDRLADTSKGDCVDWEFVDSMCGNFCSLAAFCGDLALVTAVLKERQVPFFVNHAGPIQLTWTLNESDWNALSEEDKRRYDRSLARAPEVYTLDGVTHRGSVGGGHNMIGRADIASKSH